VSFKALPATPEVNFTAFKRFPALLSPVEHCKIEFKQEQIIFVCVCQNENEIIISQACGAF